eukprot:6406295-Heterocapsa_arctica.AAC.1
MRGQSLHHMLGEGRHQRIQERGHRDHQQLYTRVLERDEREHPIQELDHPAEDRQVVLFHGEYVDRGAQEAE